MTGIQIPPPDVSVTDDAGIMTDDWYLFLSDFFSLTGASGRQLPIWSNVEVPALSMTEPSTGGPTRIVWNSPIGGFLFDASVAPVLFFGASLPRGYNEETDIYPYVLWAPLSNDTGDVIWRVDFTWGSDAATFSVPASSTITGSLTTASDRKLIRSVASSPISGVGQKPQSHLSCVITRDGPSAGDNYPGAAILMAVGFQFERSLEGTPSR